MLTRRFLNLLQGRLALMNRDVWALVLAKRCIETEKERHLWLCLCQVRTEGRWHSGVSLSGDLLCLTLKVDSTVRDKDQSTMNNCTLFSHASRKECKNNIPYTVGDEIYTIMAHSVLWLYNISPNHNVWKWHQSDDNHGLPLQGKNSMLWWKRQRNGYPRELGVDRSAV